MITGTISGQVMEKLKREKREDDPYCAYMLVEVRSWIAGREIVQNFHAYFPLWMEKRLAFYFNNDVKRITISFDCISVLARTEAGERGELTIRVNQVY